MKKLLLKFKVSLSAFISSALIANSYGQIPAVYDVENSGIGISRPATTMPVLAKCPVIVPLPDPFAWSADPLGVNPARSVSFTDWQKHRQEILDMIQNYEIGTKPTVAPEQIVASFSDTDSILTVVVTAGSQSLTLTSKINIPSGATGPLPILIGMNSPYGSMPATSFSNRGIAAMNFTHNQVTTYGGPANSDPFFKLYPTQNIDNTGQYAAWAWGVSRLIDGLYKLNGVLGGNTIDLEHIAVTGCSYAGKMALFAGAFDERIALTIAQESGGGGATSWRYSATQNGVEGLAQTDSKWFKDSMFDFGNANVWKIPTDHHLLNALVAPRALLVTGNADYEWLSNPSCFVNSKATQKIYETLGISDRFGYLVDGGHGHCAYPANMVENLDYFLDRFMKGQTQLSSIIEVKPATVAFDTIQHQKWYNWWGTGVPTPPIDIPEAPVYEGNHTLHIFKLPALPTLDGNILDDPAWKNQPWINVDKNKAVTNGTSATSAQFKIGYSNDSLYIAVQIVDPTPYFAADLSSYLRDCNELFISMDTTTRSIAGGANQYRITRGGAYDASTITCKHIVVSDEGGWSVEWALPWEKIAARESFSYTSIDAKSYPYIRFELAVADNTTGTSTGRTQQLFWNAGTDDQYNSMKNLGYVKLMGDIPPAINGNTVLDVYRLPVAPAIDGDVAEDAWANTLWTDAYKNKPITDGSATFAASAQFKVGYTNDSLYVALKVLDSTPHNEPAVSTWLRDCNELFINMDTTTRTGTNGSNQYRLQRDNSALEIATAAKSVNAKAIPILDGDNADIGWTAEWALPWSKIAAKESFAYTSIDAKPYPYVRFEFVAVDNTAGTSAGRTQQMFWNAATDDQYGGMKNMGYIKLNGLTGPASVPTVTNSTVKAYYHANQDVLVVSGYVGEIGIYDVLGKLILKTSVKSNMEQIGLSSFNRGIYLVVGSGFSTIKFIK